MNGTASSRNLEALMILFNYEILIYVIVHIRVYLQNHSKFILTWEAMHFPSFVEVHQDQQANNTVIVINHFVRVNVGSAHPQKVTIFDNLFNFLTYLKVKVCILPV